MGEPATDPAPFLPRPLLEYVAEEDPNHVALAPREFLSPSEPEGVEAEGSLWYGRHYGRESLVLYDRPRFRSPNELGGSNMCADWYTLSDDNSELIRKPEAFIKWAQRVFRWVRRYTPQWHEFKGYRVTDKVAAAIADGLTIVP